MYQDDEPREHGQIIVLFAVAIVTLILGVGLVVDVGFAWAQQRHTQNAADSAANAGAILLAHRSAQQYQGSTVTDPVTDEEVRNAVFGSAAANDVDIESATYTDWQGTDLGVTVGSLGSTTPPPAAAAGVNVAARREPGTFLVRIIGMTQWNIIQEATAVSGPSGGCFDTESGCSVLPVAFPINAYTCANNGEVIVDSSLPNWQTGVDIVLPLCRGNPGSVGFLDWTPPFGGTSELTTVIYDPPPVNIPLPSWQYVTGTGNTSADQVEDALNSYAGEVVLVPVFDGTCLDEPPNKTLDDCPAEGGAGVNQWYWVKRFLAFRLSDPRGAWISGGTANEAVCGPSHECLTGAFVTYVTQGTVSGPCTAETCGPGSALGVQLIK
ncbi:MAG TPA: pilus assembly protein TadG-related protein [Candidatus Limnocylindrales bacterium]|nr:pilus assembly protein TadG-related protein [Candidatus Limnocylindrales bacterium]